MGDALKRLTSLPADSCPIWALDAVSKDEAIRIGFIAAGGVAVIAALTAVLICIWLMPREAK